MKGKTAELCEWLDVNFDYYSKLKEVKNGELFLPEGYARNFEDTLGAELRKNTYGAGMYIYKCGVTFVEPLYKCFEICTTHVPHIELHKEPFNSLACAPNAQPADDDDVRLLIKLPDYIIKAR